MVAPLVVKIALGWDLNITVYVSEEGRYPLAIVLDGLPAVVCGKSIGKPGLHVG